MGQRHYSGDPDRGTLCDVRRGAGADLRGDAARQHRAWRSDRALGLCLPDDNRRARAQSLTSIIIVGPVMAAIGYALQRLLLNRTLGDDLLPPLLVTFGLSVIIQNGLLELFTA